MECWKRGSPQGEDLSKRLWEDWSLSGKETWKGGPWIRAKGTGNKVFPGGDLLVVSLERKMENPTVCLFNMDPNEPLFPVVTPCNNYVIVMKAF